jgi:RNA polymerase primary sigma factor
MAAIGRSTVGDVASRDDALLVDVAVPSELDELKDLLAEGQERGFLTQEEVAARLEEVDLSEEHVRELYAHLADQGIDLIAAEQVVDPAAETAAPAEEPDQPRTPAIDLTVEPSLDSLRLYLRSIGKVELLSAP